MRPFHLGHLIVALACATSAPARRPSPDSIRFDRLTALGRLWATVKYFHPALGYQPSDWDSALVATIPSVDGNSSTEAFGAAAQRMLDALNDPVTRVTTADAPGKISPTDPEPASIASSRADRSDRPYFAAGTIPALLLWPEAPAEATSRATTRCGTTSSNRPIPGRGDPWSS